MKSFQVKFESRKRFVEELKHIRSVCKQLPYCHAVFYLTWTKEAEKDLPVITEAIERYFEDAIYYGNEASGNIFEGTLELGITVTCYLFEEPGTTTKLIWVEEGTEIASLEDLWTLCRSEIGLKAVELIPSISYLDVLKIDNSVPDIDKSILLFGGASVNYDNPSFEADILAKGHEKTREGMAVILYFGDGFHVSTTYVRGWKGLGRTMRVTKSEGKIISEIDGLPAHAIYEKYLNLQDEDNDNLVFPLIVEENGIEYIRTPQAFLPDKSMRMFANISEGSLVRLAYGDKNTILSSLYEEASGIASFAPQALKAYSCAARRLFWGDEEVHKETLPLQEIAPVCGFYTGGEILRFGKKLRVLNSTLVIISFREGEEDQLKIPSEVLVEKNDKSLISRITYFIEQIAQEQEAQKNQLQESLAFTNFFLGTYISAYYVDLTDYSCQIYKRTADLDAEYPVITDYVETFRQYIEKHVVAEDREAFWSLIQSENLKEKLKENPEITHEYRVISFGVEKTIRVQVICGADENHAAIGFRDITNQIKEQRENQRILETALRDAEVANRSKTEFLFNMSHDIRTPMNAIIGFTNMAEKHIDDKEKVLECLEKSQQSSNLLLSLINSVLEVSRIESGNGLLEEQECDIYSSFFGIENTMRQLAESRDIDLTFDFGPIENRCVYCDINRANRVFVNIITNAIKYTREGGYVKVRCEQIGKAAQGKASFRYTFEDNGIGMSAEFQKHVFEQFSRERNVTKSGIQGTGLGMAVCKSFVDLMGGTISVVSEQGKGSTFTVVLPLRLSENDRLDLNQVEDKALAEVKGKHSTEELRGKRILLVEDNEMNREIAADILLDSGLVVETAENGEVATRLVSDNGIDYYDFVLMDIQMPVMNGYEATAKIRELPHSDKLPIIALSANAFKEDLERSLQSGMNAHVAKPIDVSKLLSTLCSLLP